MTFSGGAWWWNHSRSHNQPCEELRRLIHDKIKHNACKIDSDCALTYLYPEERKLLDTGQINGAEVSVVSVDLLPLVQEHQDCAIKNKQIKFLALSFADAPATGVKCIGGQCDYRWPTEH